MTPPADRRGELVMAAATRLQAGAADDVRRRLRDALQAGVLSEPVDGMTCLALRLLGQAARQLGDLQEARAAYEEARALAGRLGQPSLESGAVEGLALVARADGELLAALERFDEAAQLAERAGDRHGHAAVLVNKGNTLLELSRHGEAREALQEALACGELQPAQRAAAEDNLAEALAAEGRLDEAIETAESAAATFEAAGMGFDRYQTLRHLERLQRDAGRGGEAAGAFAAARELIAALEAASLDPEHYRRFPERAHEIEAETERRLHGQGGEGAWIDIGLHAMLGSDLAEEADREYERGNYEQAEHALQQALAHWEHLGADHMLPRVHNSLGLVYTETGQAERALRHLQLARRQAHRLGDAMRESFACTNLCRFALDDSREAREVDPLQLIARARALQALAVEQMEQGLGERGAGEPPLGASPDYGVLDALEASVCYEHGALEPAERAASRAVELMEEALAGGAGEASRYRLALRLIKLYGIRRKRGMHGEADDLVGRLEELAGGDESPRTAFAVNAALGRELFEDGRWDATTLERLRSACDAYERLRSLALRVGDLEGYADMLRPPFGEAVEVAIQLGLPDEALHLLERSKARSLLDALRDGGHPPAGDKALAREAELWRESHDAHAEFDRADPDEAPADRVGRLLRAGERLRELEPELERAWRELEADRPEVVAHRLARPATTAQLAEALRARRGDPLLIELFAGPRSVHAFTLGGEGELAVHRLADAVDGPWAELDLLVRERAGDGAEPAREALRHPALRELSSFIASVAGDRPVFLVPHRSLHALPLHLDETGNGGLTPRPRTFHLPSASLLRYGGAGAGQAAGELVAGDPLGDLPFAALEAEAVATRVGAAAETGSACTPSWLASRLTPGHPPLRLTHLACHAVFHPRRGDRSGLLLAGDDGAALVPVRDLAKLDWSGELVVLSACSSGQHEVRDGDELAGISRALLGRGAGALVTALWNVPDLATYLLASHLYERLSVDSSWSTERVGAALADAQRCVRDLTAGALLDTAARLHGSAVGGEDERLARCALLAAATAHRAAGNRVEWLRCREGVKSLDEGRPPAPDVGALSWEDQPAIAAAPAYAATPFSDPAHWGAFVLSGCG